MHKRWQTAGPTPAWNGGGDQRMFVSLGLATLIVAGLLHSLSMPAVPAWSPLLKVVVQIVNTPTAPRAKPEPETAPLPVPETTPDVAEILAEPPPAAGQQERQDSAPATDWNVVGEQAMERYLDSELETYGYVNRDLAEKRSSLSERYLPGTHEKKKPIWENVEVDTLGRSVLRSGDCFKVLDDPNVGSREAFEMFGQFIAQCTWQGRYPKNLPWVDDVLDRHAYLRDPEYYPGEE